VAAASSVAASAPAARLLPERTTLADVIHVELRRRVITLAYRPGTMIFENVVAAEFGVSRTPVRQAFARLAAEGLLQVLPQRGALVPRLSARKVREAQAVREALEIAAFAEVAGRWDESAPACRRAARDALAGIEAQKRAVARGDYLAFVGLDAAWHDLILGLGGNTTLAGIVADMRVHLTRLRYLELQEAHHEAEGIVWHERILAALRAGDVEATRTLLAAHLQMLEGLREELFGKYADVFA
jgi:GntR family transcriptional regulator, rspAB operon transcriptional repressor